MGMKCPYCSSPPREIILKVIPSYAEGLSLSKIRDFIWKHDFATSFSH